jgi:pimeloyl-ACP methyl ester carboxylesterase
MKLRALAPTVAVALVLAAPASAQSEQVGTSFPSGFPTIIDASLGKPVLGFGSNEGRVARTPVVFLHGNNDTPYPTACNPAYGKMQSFADFLLANGYRPSELWGLGYQGDQCDLIADQTLRSAVGHTSVASVPDLRAFVRAVLDYTGASQVDIVAHSLGGTIAREWLRQDVAYTLVRSLVTVASPHHGIINCSPSPLNYWQLPAFGGFVPSSAVCVELGAVDTPFLSALNAGDETPARIRQLTFRATDSDLVYISAQDGLFPAVPALDRDGDPTDFSRSPTLAGATNVGLAGQGAYDPAAGSAHLGLWNSPEVWGRTLDFLRRSRR